MVQVSFIVMNKRLNMLFSSKMSQRHHSIRCNDNALNRCKLTKIEMTSSTFDSTKISKKLKFSSFSFMERSFDAENHNLSLAVATTALNSGNFQSAFPSSAHSKRNGNGFASGNVSNGNISPHQLIRNSIGKFSIKLFNYQIFEFYFKFLEFSKF